MSFRYTGPGVERRTFESLSKPIMYLDAKQNELEDKIGLLEGEAAKYKKVALEEPNSKAAQYYNEFNKAIQQQADTLSNEGVFSNNIRNNVIKLNTVYNSNILPIGQAYEQKIKELERQRVAKLNNQNLRFSKNANEISIDDYMNNTADYKVLDLNKPVQEGLQTGKILSAVNRGDTFKKVLGGQKQLWTKTLGYDPDEFLQAGGAAEQVVTDYYNKIKEGYDPELLGKFGKEIESAFKNGVLLGTGKSTQTQLVEDKNWDYVHSLMLQNNANKNQKDIIDYQYNKEHPKPNGVVLPKGVEWEKGEEAIKADSKLKGDKNALNNLAQAKANPTGKFYNNERYFIDKELSKIDSEIAKKSNRRPLGTNGNSMYQVSMEQNYAYSPKKGYEKDVAKLQKQRANILKNGVLVSGNDITNHYMQSYKTKDINELSTKLNNDVMTGTHRALLGVQLTSEYSSAAANVIATNSSSKKLIESTNNGKLGDIRDYFKLVDNKYIPKDGIKTVVGYNPSKQGYYLEVQDGKKTKRFVVDDNLVTVPQTYTNPITGEVKVGYPSEIAKQNVDFINKNKGKLTQQDIDKVMQSTLTVISNVAGVAANDNSKTTDYNK